MLRLEAAPELVRRSRDAIAYTADDIAATVALAEKAFAKVC